jgi:hypothetical protein
LLWIFFDDVKLVNFVFESGNVVVLGIGEEGVGIHVVSWVGEVMVVVRLRWGVREARVHDRDWEEEQWWGEEKDEESKTILLLRMIRTKSRSFFTLQFFFFFAMGYSGRVWVTRLTIGSCSGLNIQPDY